MNDDRTPTGRLDEALPSRLTPLRSLHNFRIAEGDPDVRSWSVYGANGRKIGEVSDLLVDSAAMRVRYLAVALDSSLYGDGSTATASGPVGTTPVTDEAMNPDTPLPVTPAGLDAPITAHAVMAGVAPLTSEAMVRSTLSDEENRLTAENYYGADRRHILVPIGQARLDDQRDRVVIEGLRAEDAAGLPDYNGEEVSGEYEADLRRRFDHGYAPTAGSDFYAHDLYNDERFYSPRRQRQTSASQPAAEAARVAGLEPGGATGQLQDREITGELDRAVDAPDHSTLRDDGPGVRQEEPVLPLRGR